MLMMEPLDATNIVDVSADLSTPLILTRVLYNCRILFRSNYIYTPSKAFV
jgi:hypothetical protein